MSMEMQSEPRAVVKGRLRFLVGGVLGIAVCVLLIIGGFVEGLLSGCIAAVPGILGINLLVMGFRRSN
ncbi:MAG TPA: hypothetical protein VEZ90_02305 [Blastocatellia bacterium]|nr:hypothetical protein [Blastocatellia bacterium]